MQAPRESSCIAAAVSGYKGGEEEEEKTRSARRTSVASLPCVAVDLNESTAVSADDNPNIGLPRSKIPVPRGLMIIIIIIMFPIPCGRWTEAGLVVGYNNGEGRGGETAVSDRSDPRPYNIIIE